MLLCEQLIGLESRQSQEMSEHLRSQERELEQLHHQWEKDLERLRAKNKSELENRVCACSVQIILISFITKLVLFLCANIRYSLLTCSSGSDRSTGGEEIPAKPEGAARS